MSIVSKAISAILLVCSLCMCANAQVHRGIEHVGQIYGFWDAPVSMELEGNTLYLSTEEGGLHLLDISNPDNPQVITSLKDGYGGNIRIKDDLILRVNSIRFKIFRISPENQLHSIYSRYVFSDPDAFECYNGSISIGGNSTFLADVQAYDIYEPWGGFIYYRILWFDISDPTYLELNVINSNEATTSHFTSIENQLILRTNNRLGIYNHSNFNSLELVGNLDLHTPVSTWEMDESFIYAFGDTTFRIYDIREPEDPDEYSTLTLEEAVSIRVILNHDRACVIGYRQDQTSFVTIIDVTDRLQPEILNSVNLEREVLTAEIDDELLLVSTRRGEDYSKELTFFDYSGDSLQVRFSGSNSGSIEDFIISEDLLICRTESNMLDVIDISQPPQAPTLARHQLESDCVNMQTDHNILYFSQDKNEIYAVELTDIDNFEANIRLVYEGNHFHQFLPREGRMYLRNRQNDIEVYRIRENDRLEYISTVGFPGEYRHEACKVLDVIDDTFYAGFDNTCLALDISDLRNPVLLSENRLRGYPIAVERRGDYLFIADSTDIEHYDPGIWIYDVADPESPQFVNCHLLENRGPLHGVSFQGDFIFATTRLLETINISNPRRTEVTGFYNFQMQPGKTLSSNGFAFTNGFSYIEIYDCREVLDVQNEKPQIPADIHVGEPYPNPFNSSVTIDFTIPYQAETSVRTYTIDGRSINEIIGNNLLKAGQHQIIWNADGLPAGSYYFHFNNGHAQIVRPVTLIK